MANQITFTIETDAPYSEKEKENLLDAFLEFIVGEDGDVDTDSVEVSIVDADSIADADNQKKREIVEDFLKKMNVTARVYIAEPENLGVETVVTLD